MQWRDILRLPSYISDLEITTKALKAASSNHREEIDKLNKELSLLTDEIGNMKGRVPIGEKNEISETGPDEVDLTGDEDYRIPMMNGMKLQFEGEDKTIPLNIYGSGSKQKIN